MYQTLTNYANKVVNFITLGQFGGYVWLGQFVLVVGVILLSTLVFKKEERSSRFSFLVVLLAIVEMVSLIFV